MGYKMNISSLRKAFIFMGAVAALSLVNAQSALAANESAKDMTCQEFIDLNPKAMTPVAWWMLHEETVYKGGDTVTLNETDLTQIPKVIEYCKKNPQKNLYTFKNQAQDFLQTKWHLPHPDSVPPSPFTVPSRRLQRFTFL